jgi:hypothetical protein
VAGETLTPDELHRNNSEGAVRQLVFGAHGEGMVTYLILDDQRRVDVLRVLWAC